MFACAFFSEMIDHLEITPGFGNESTEIVAIRYTISMAEYKINL